MRLLYATSLRFPSSLANRIQIVSMARAFSRMLGADFCLGISEGAGELDIQGRIVEMGSRARSPLLAWRYMRYAQKNAFTHIYCREEKLLFFLILYARSWFRSSRFTFCYEIHRLEYAQRWWHRYMLARIPLAVSITEGMKDDLVERIGYGGSLLVAADAVDPALFDIPETKEAARSALGLPQDRIIVLYAGSLESWKGCGTFYDSIAHADPSWLYVIVGGKPAWIDEFLETHPAHPDVLMEGQKSYESELPLYLRAADIAVIPNSAKEEISRVSTSPLKLFAYMASDTPIVASDLPSLREILSEDLAALIAPDDPEALATGIRDTLSDPARSAQRAALARDLVRERYTWDQRAEEVLSFIQDHA